MAIAFDDTQVPPFQGELAGLKEKFSVAG